MNILEKKYNNIGLIRPLAIAVSIIALFFIYNETTNIGFAYIGIGIMLLSALFLNPLECFLIAIALNSNIRMIRLLDNPIALQSYFMFLFQLKYFILNKCRYPSIFILNIVFAIITALLVNDFSLISWALRGVFFIVFVCNVYKNDCPEKYIEKTIIIFLVGTVLSQLLVIYSTITSGLSVFVGNLTAMNNDRNFNAAIVANAFAVVIFYLLDKKHKLPYVIAAFILVFTGMLSGSRTFIMTIGLTLFIYVLIIIRGKSVKDVKFMRFFVFLFLIALLYAAPVILSKFNDILFSRFMDDDMATGSGRFDAWAFFMGQSFDNIGSFLFGNGDAIKWVTAGKVENIEHNTFIQSIFMFGYLGFITLIGCYLKEYQTITLSRVHVQKWYLTTLIITLFFYSSISAIYSAQFDTGILMSILIIRYLQSNQIKVQLKNN